MLKTIAIIGFESRLSPLRLRIIKVNRTHAIVGASPPHNQVAAGVTRSAEKIFGLSPAAGGRGCQERNCASVIFSSFINDSFQFGFDFLQAVAVTPRHGVG